MSDSMEKFTHSPVQILLYVLVNSHRLMNWEQCARGLVQWFKHSPNASIWAKPKTKPVLHLVFAVTWHTWHIPGYWRPPEQFKCLFMTFSFLVKEMTSDCFSVIKSPPELQGFTEIPGGLSWDWNVWRVVAGGGVTAVPVGYPVTSITNFVLRPRERHWWRAGREQSSQLFFCRYFAAGMVWFLSVLWDFGCVEEKSRDGDAHRQLCCSCQQSELS